MFFILKTKAITTITIEDRSNQESGINENKKNSNYFKRGCPRCDFDCMSKHK